jgi:hypothetical protein
LPTRLIWLVFVAGLALRPIAADDFWWQVARGRAVWQGTASPSASLLALDTAREADWFGGVPLFVIHDVAGFHGLMLLRVVAVVGMVALLIRLAGGLRSAGAATALAIGLTVCLPALDVTPRMFDAIGLLLVATMVSTFGSDAVGGRSPLAPLAALAVWANLATMPIIGWALFAAARVDAVITGRSGGSPAAQPRPPCAGAVKWLSLELLLAAGACSLTPRGVFTLWDSLRLGVPKLVAEAAVLQETAWRPLVVSAWGLSELAFVLLTIVAFWQLLKQPPSVVVCVQVFAAATLGWLNVAAVPIAALWLTVAITQIWRAGGVSSPVIPIATNTNRGADAPRSPEMIDGLRPLRRWRHLIPAIVFAGWTVIVWLPWPSDRPGWGLDPRVDHRLLDAALREVTLDGTAWADDVRSAGMCSWVTRGRIKPHDVPQRALLGGRLRDFVLLRHDLDWNRLSRYRREDDSWGGWWLPLRERRTGLVLVAAERTRLIRSLEPTIWKPLALDSPVLPYGQAGDPGASARIVQILKLRDFVEDGAWVSHLLGPSGTDLSLDLWGFAGGMSPNLEQELRQSRVFRAMHLPRAGLRVLLPALRVSQSPPMLHEFAQCNRDLGEAETRLCGYESSWRAELAHRYPAFRWSLFSEIRWKVWLLTSDLRWRLRGDAVEPFTSDLELGQQSAEFVTESLDSTVFFWQPPERWIEGRIGRWGAWGLLPESWGPAFMLIGVGDFEGALAVLDDGSDDPRTIYARSCLANDMGQLDRAREELTGILQIHTRMPRDYYRVLAQLGVSRAD